MSTITISEPSGWLLYIGVSYSGWMSPGDFHNLSRMDFALSQEQEDFLRGVDRACKSIREYEEECYLKQVINDRLVPAFSKIGMLGCPVSKRYGGLGLDILTYVSALMRIGEEGSSPRTFFSVHTSIGQLVLQGWGTDSQKSRYLEETVTGKRLMAFALTEPGAGSDPSAMATSYEKRGSNYVLNGEKHWIGNGTIAGLLTTFARERNTGKISAFLVDGDSTGLASEEMRHKVGLLSLKNAHIRFDNCTVSEENLLGQEGQGLGIAMSALIDGRLSVAAGAVGVMRDCLAECIKYTKVRVQHGEPLAKKQLIQEHIARIAVDIESSLWLVYRAAEARQTLHDFVELQKKDNPTDWIYLLGRQNKEYVRLRTDADYLASVAKFHASNCSFEAANRSVQIFGSVAYQKTNRVARHFLDSRATMIYEGANEVLELKIASHLLGEGEYRAY